MDFIFRKQFKMEEKKKLHFSTVEEYLALQPESVRVILEQLRQVIKKAAPEAEELISYKMPAYKFHGNAGLVCCIQKPLRVICFAKSDTSQ